MTPYCSPFEYPSNWREAGGGKSGIVRRMLMISQQQQWFTTTRPQIRRMQAAYIFHHLVGASQGALRKRAGITPHTHFTTSGPAGKASAASAFRAGSRILPPRGGW